VVSVAGMARLAAFRVDGADLSCAGRPEAWL
jgi:hypothetical protein